MTDEQKLEALVQRAINNGWTWQTFQGRYFPDYLGERTANHIAITMNDMRLNCLLFNHDFARALFGEEVSETVSFNYLSASIEAKKPLIGSGLIPVYLHHMQEALASKDPIDYMYGVVFGE